MTDTEFDFPLPEVAELLGQEYQHYADAISELVSEIRADNALVNINTGLNTPGIDKLSGEAIAASIHKYSPQARTRLRYANFIIGNLVEILPASMCVKFCSYKIENEPDFTIWMNDQLFKAKFYFKEALEQAREQGGAGIVIYADDGRNLDQPLDKENIKSIKKYKVFSSEDLPLNSWNQDPSSPEYGEIESYKIAGTNQVVHESRVIKFHGLPLYGKLLIENNGWGLSVIDRAVKKITNLDQGSDMIATSIQDFNQTILFIKDLAKRLAVPGRKEQVKEHIRTIALLKSGLGIIALDADNERYEIHSRNYSGLDGMIEHLVQMASGACDLPSTILLNRSATAGAGKGSIVSNSGLQGRKEWADFVRARQEFDLLPQIIYLIDILEKVKESPRKGKPPEHRDITFPSISEPTVVEQATIDEQKSREMSTYIQSQVVTPEQVQFSLVKGVPLSVAIPMNNSNRENKSTEIINQPANQQQ